RSAETSTNARVSPEAAAQSAATHVFRNRLRAPAQELSSAPPAPRRCVPVPRGIPGNPPRVPRFLRGLPSHHLDKQSILLPSDVSYVCSHGSRLPAAFHERFQSLSQFLHR